MNSLMPLLTVSVIAGFWSCAEVAFIALRVVTKSSIVRCTDDEVKAGLAAVDGVEVAADDQRLAVPPGAGGGLRVADHAVAADRLAEQVGVALGVGGEARDLLGVTCGRVHARHPFALAKVLVPAVEPQAHVADLHRRASGERPVGDRHVVLGRLVACAGPT